MKTKISILFLFIFIAGNSFAQKMDSWKELSEYHKVMASTFHPSEEGDLAPIKKRASELKEKADALAKSEIPAQFNNEKIKASLIKLQEQSYTMEQMVKNNAPDKDITTYLSTLHDTFHEIVGLCKGEDHGKEKTGHEGHGHD